MRKKDVVNLTGGLTTTGGKTLYGLDAEVYKKMQAKEDPNLERKVGEWIENVLEREIEDTSDLWKSLKSGVVLVELMNTIRPGTITRYNKKPMHVLMERENISLYLEACWKIGIPSSELFITPDLHIKNSIVAVINNLIALSDIAHCFGQVTVPSLRGSDRNVVGTTVTKTNVVAKKWNVPSIQTPIYSEQLEGDEDLEFLLTKTQKELKVALDKIAVMEKSSCLLKEDLKVSRKQTRELAEKKKEFNQEWSVELGEKKKQLEREQCRVRELEEEKRKQEVLIQELDEKRKESDVKRKLLEQEQARFQELEEKFKHHEARIKELNEKKKKKKKKKSTLR
eukprot:TRINITY_DN950_c0_g1_i16.p1 TRINITY_DN950_c0_g1~~TRINITY_DN950_c0_g1_i16.p1  ORF type:complete len:339 (-),score=99.36 TRINITY_DN950_c0_g1_i16:144-1160(-)